MFILQVTVNFSYIFLPGLEMSASMPFPNDAPLVFGVLRDTKAFFPAFFGLCGKICSPVVFVVFFF